MKNKLTYISFGSALIILIVLFVSTIIRTNDYNSKTYNYELTGSSFS